MKTIRWITIFFIITTCFGIVLFDTASGAASNTASPLSPDADNPNPPATPAKLIFVHHSTGGNWLADTSQHESAGGLGRALMDNNYYVSATNYGWEAGGDAIGDRTDIGNWWEWFRGPDSATFTTALYNENGQNIGDFGSWPRLSSDPGGENTVIMFKSCYPNSHLRGNPADPATTGDNPLRGMDAWSDEHTVANAKGIYTDILEYFATRQDKLFIVITAPPLLEDDMYQPTDAAHAANARAFNDWLVNDWLDGYPHNNVAVFDFFNVLTSNGGNHTTHDLGAMGGNHHRWWSGAIQHVHPVSNDFAAYAADQDSHPTSAGGQKATGEFIQWLNVQYNNWAGGGPSVTPTPSPTPTETSPPPSGTETVTLQQGASYSGMTDAILADDGEDNANLGSLDHLEVFRPDEGEFRRSLLQWDLSSLPAGIHVNSASLELYHYESDIYDPIRMVLYAVTHDWTEGTGAEFWPDASYIPDGATWGTCDGSQSWTPGGEFNPSVIAQKTLANGTAYGWVTWDVTTAVRAWIENGSPNHGLLLRPTDGHGYIYFASSEYTTSDLRPRLMITYSASGSAVLDKHIYLPIVTR